MQGIGPGSILGGRYTADRRTAQYAGAERWNARDITLDRAVVLFTVPRSHPNVDAVLDAARRSAGLENSRLSRILDVGMDDDVAYVVEEALDGSHSLASLLAASPLPAPEVRRIAGETALVLDLARHRGLHHQRLTPDLVLRTTDGDVKVRGLATMAALVGVDDVDDQTAARTDAMAVVAIAYAGFTGHWPLAGDGGGLPPAPRVGANVAAPSEIAVGVPADLDALCRLTFANNQGPVTPGDFARQIAPWSPIPVLLPTLDAPEQSDVSHPRDWAARAPLSHSAPAESRPERPAARKGAEPDRAEPDGADRDRADRDRADRDRADRDRADHDRVAGKPGPQTDRAADPGAERTADPDPATDTRDTDSTRAQPTPHRATDSSGAPVPVARRVPAHPEARPEGAQPTLPQGARPSAPQPGSAGAGQPVGAAGAAGAGQAVVPTPEAGAAAEGAARPTGSGQPTGPGQLTAMTAATTAALGSAGAATVSAAKSLSGRLTGWSATTRDRAQVAVGDMRARRDDAAAARSAQAARAAQGSTETRADGQGPHPMGPVAPGTHERGQDVLEPPVPLLPPSAAEPLTRDQSRLAIGIIVGFLVLALALAMWGLSRIPSLPALSTGDGASPGPTATATAGATDSDGDGTPDAPAAGAPLTFVAASDFDPLGDGAERPEELPNILDGDDSTSWGSEGYRTASFSGLKPGLGIVLDLGETSSVSEVTLVLPSESVGTIFVTDDEGYAADGKTLADDLTAAGSFDGSDTVTVPMAAGASGRFVIVWFTEISTGGEQWYRARLAGATATS